MELSLKKISDRSMNAFIKINNAVNTNCIATPVETVRSMLSLLPNSVWNKESKFLFPASKFGEFEMEVIKRLTEHSDYNHVIENQIFIACVDKKQAYIVRKLLTNHVRSEKLNMKIGDFSEEEMEFKDIFGNKIEKFDVVVGNPPYSKQTNNGSVKIYHKFIEKSLGVTRYLLFVTPTEFTGRESKYKAVKQQVLVNKKLVSITFCDDSKEIGFNTDNAGGLCYYLIDNENENNTYSYNDLTNKITERREFSGDTIFRSTDVSEQQIKRLKSHYKEKFFDSVVMPNKPFGMRTRPYIDGKEYYDYIIEDGCETVMCMGRHDECSVCGHVLHESSTNKCECVDQKIMKNVRKLRPMNIKYITKNNDLIKKYKVIAASAIGGAYMGLGKVYVLEPNIVCTETYNVLYSCDNKNEAELVKEFMMSDIVTSLVKTLKKSQHQPLGVFANVPVPQFYNGDTLRTLDDIITEIKTIMG